jgi:hypothetical protein
MEVDGNVSEILNKSFPSDASLHNNSTFMSTQREPPLPKAGGDPDLRPICSYEVAWLVRMFHDISSYCNKEVSCLAYKLLSQLSSLDYIPSRFLFFAFLVSVSLPDSGFPYSRGHVGAHFQTGSSAPHCHWSVRAQSRRVQGEDGKSIAGQAESA